jgi:hypothetical protein
MYKFYNNLSFEQAIDHKQQNWNIDDPYSYRCWYEEDVTEKEILVITVGDSWTWGDHLGVIDWDKASNDPCRMEEIAGRVLSNRMRADWVNIARPGCSNYWMIEQLINIEDHLHRVRNKYKQIYVVVTLTEDLRESTYARRINVDKPYQEFWDNSNSIKEFLVKVEGYLFYNLEEFFKRVPFVNAKVSRAFTDVWPENTSPLLLEKTWCDVIQDNIQFDRYWKPVPFVGQMAIDPLNEKFMSQLSGQRELRYKEEFLDIMDRVGRRWNFLGASDYNLKGSTYHPNAAGHRLWGDYLYVHIR